MPPDKNMSATCITACWPPLPTKRPLYAAPANWPNGPICSSRCAPPRRRSQKPSVGTISFTSLSSASRSPHPEVSIMNLSKTLPVRSAPLFSKADRLELNLCQRLNRMGAYAGIRLFFRIISRLGDGVFWYVLALLLPLLLGMQGLAALGHITVTGLICVAVYSQLKNRLVRQRPFISWAAIRAHTAPLDLYSFPSGHTMNAVNFAVLFSVFY